MSGRSVLVPGNASRYFSTSEEAVSQPHGRLSLDLSEAGHLHNPLYAHELIRFDDKYLTTSCQAADGQSWLPTFEYLPRVLTHFDDELLTVCDIGCGQGEFVTALHAQGIDARGFDPVLRTPTDFLHREYWRPDDPRGDSDLLVMRCVLPHIADPWAWLEYAATRPRHVLVEYQRVEWLAENAVWCGLNHDHVNYFTLADFFARSAVVDAGTFAEGEWQWVLLSLAEGVWTKRPSSSRESAASRDLLQRSERLLVEREDAVERLCSRAVPIVLWGAAGKGVVAADAFVSAGVEVLAAVDLDRGKHGSYLECSGCQVIPPDSLPGLLTEREDARVVVMNPRHRFEVEQFLGPHLSHRCETIAD
jgi:hypothetical protein